MYNLKITEYQGGNGGEVIEDAEVSKETANYWIKKAQSGSLQLRRDKDGVLTGTKITIDGKWITQQCKIIE